MKAPVYSKEGKKKGDKELNGEIFGARVNARLLELVRTAYAANLRHGTASTKGRAEVRGGGKKPWKQKGTGRARASSTRSPLWRGGGTTFGPQPRKYTVDLPSTMRRSALISALSQKAGLQKLVLLESLDIPSGKTRDLASVVESLPLENKRALCVVKEISEELKRSGRNIQKRFEVRKASDLNAYHVIERDRLLIAEDALEILEKRVLGGQKDGKTSSGKESKKS